jgi:hypothetical protein
MSTKAQFDFDKQLLLLIVYVSYKSLFTIEAIQLKFVKVIIKISPVQGIESGSVTPNHVFDAYTVELMQTRKQRLVAQERV